MFSINLSDTTHLFKKQNLVTLSDKKGSYDLYKCEACGLQGKRRSFAGVVEVKKDKKCSNTSHENDTLKKIKIIKCTAFGPSFSNLKPGTIHDVINPPKPYKNDATGVWVMGNGEPVKILNAEFEKL